MPFRKPGGEGPRPTDVTETLVATGTTRGAMTAGWDADHAVTALYGDHYGSLVRLAALLVRDFGTAEEVVQDVFVAMHASWRRLRDPDKALSYLRQAVVNKSRSVLRHRAVVEKYAPEGAPGRAERRERGDRGGGAQRGRTGTARAADPPARGTGTPLLR